MSSSAAAGRSLRSNRRTPITPTAKTPKVSVAPEKIPPDGADLTKTVQKLEDELEELADAKARLENKVTQLEERAHYLEANARLNESMLSKEIMDLKEKSRKLEIDLSTVMDERDSLEQEKEQLVNQVADIQVMDEAKQLSTKLKDAWLRISTMTASQNEYVQKLYQSEEANAKLKSDLAKSVDLSNTTRNTLAEEKRRWGTEKQEYIVEIDSLKKILAQSSKDGDKQMIDWEEDKERIRNGLKHERSVWDKEKKGFLDQIASLKVKTTTLSVQKIAPPEWILEKHQLVEKCANLQSRVSSLEGDRTSGGSGHDGPNVKRLELEKQKLEKKIEILKAKFVEVIHNSTKTDKENTKQEHSVKKSGQSQRSRPKARRRNRSSSTESESDDENGIAVVQERVGHGQDTVSANAVPSLRTTRAKRMASVKKVDYRISSEESAENDESKEREGSEEEDDTDEPEEDDPEDDSADGDDDGSEQEQVVEEEHHNKDEDVDMEETGNVEDHAAKTVPLVRRKENSPAVKRARNKDVPVSEDEGAHPTSTNRSKRSTAGKSRRSAQDDTTDSDSDSEFEPIVKAVVKTRNRGKGGDKKVVDPTYETAPKKPKASPQSKRQVSESETMEPSAESLSSPHSEAALTESPTATSTAPSSTPSSTPSTATASTTEMTALSIGNGATAQSTGNIKVKKKRKLLTGKGVEELGDILNGPGSSLSSVPSTGLVFGQGSMRSGSNNNNNKNSNSGESSLLKGPKTVKMEALNAIKMAFALPKPRNASPG
ncbi:hypothetical protein BGZ65_004206 [Modicella reniformis]|uniref:Uncharacterized protein n=1 Tax=Modicella reniformis TaxID=1440133 RepID=A0A9P6M2Y0_9FUNG|nr:hypothetical protein BGZ65_004206 [Modicella reniformis]